MKSTFLQKHSISSVIFIFVFVLVVQIVNAQGVWTSQVSPATQSLIMVKVVNQNVAWACGNGGTVVRCVNGSTWTKVDGGVFGAEPLYFICAIDANTAFVSFTKGINLDLPRVSSDTTWIYRTTDGGSSWQIVFQQIGGQIEDMRMSDPLNGFAFGDPTPGDSTLTVIRTRDGGAHWNHISTEPAVTNNTPQSAELGIYESMAVTDTNHIWFVTVEVPAAPTYWIRRTSDGGKTWSRIIFPHFGARNITFADSLQGLLTWESISTNKFGSDRTTDGGQTWITVFQRTGVRTSYAVSSVPGGIFWMVDSSNVYEINASDPLVLGLPAARKTTLPSPIIYGIDMRKESGSLFGWLVTRNGKIYKYEPRQWQFKKYAGNPVLTAGPAGSWDADGVTSGSVMYHNSKYHMWYPGVKGAVVSIGYAYSDDGVAWTKYANNPVLVPGAVGNFDAALYGCNVLFCSGKFHMWYDGINSGVTKIGYAYSDDGIKWTKHPTAVYGPGSVGSWDVELGGVGPVVKEDTVLKMFYWGKSSTSSYMTCLATSPDSIHWTRYNSGNPVLGGGRTGAWDQYSQYPGTVLKNGEFYEMWYGNWTPSPYCIGYASSTDGGFSWTTYADNPILRADAGMWDASWTIWPMIVRRPDGRYLLYYTGSIGGTKVVQSIGLAIDSAITTPEIVHRKKLVIPESFALSQNYPNPFNPTTVISYQLPVNSFVTLKVYDLLGRGVATLVNEKKSAGNYSVQWNAKVLSSGIYFYRMQTESFSDVKKMILMK
ncbi:MAG: T9SS type A sorting domain-containing protein [Bacteroidota bacterium]|nr:T9SS type A sorting domain-containing protein [Bacteroidota bacterium]